MPHLPNRKCQRQDTRPTKIRVIRVATKWLRVELALARLDSTRMTRIFVGRERL